jgi:TetR/AcrR family transcriptional regulator of autoinduction and epiphytic fitness
MTSPRVDPRFARTRKRVFSAAREVLRAEGLGGTTMDAIATQAGVARSTLYRNWDSREELLTAAIEEASDFHATPTDRSAAVRLEMRMQQVASALAGTEWGKILPAGIAAAEANPVIFADYRDFMDRGRAEFLAIVHDGKERGELPKDLSEDKFVDALVGPLFYRRLLRQLASDESWVRDHLRRVLHAFDALCSDVSGWSAKSSS